MVRFAIASRETPATLGFTLPAEWEKHEATWLGWPHHEPDWPGKLEAIEWVYCEIARKIAEGETVRMLVKSEYIRSCAYRKLNRAGADLRRIELIVYPTNRGWLRDTGPIFVRRRARKRLETAIVHCHFNGWAKYDNWELDRRIPSMAGRISAKQIFFAKAEGRDFVLEGGGIDSNGRGTLLTTEECYLDQRTQVRNPGLSREGFESTVRAYLGVTNVLWLRSGIAGDDTHGHVDDLCRFVNPNTIVLVREEDPKDVNYRHLAENWERVQDFHLEDGSKPEVVALPMPHPLFCDGERLPASYANFYIANAAVLVPTFNDPNDRVALGILGELFKDRPVVGIHAVDLALGYGTLHCLTQQQPAVDKAPPGVRKAMRMAREP